MAAKEGWYRDPIAERWWDGIGWSSSTRASGETSPDGPIAVDNADDPAGWRPDPFTERFWNGSQWTAETRAKERSSSPTTTPSPSQPTPVQQTSSPQQALAPPSSKPPSPTARRYKRLAVLAAVVVVVSIGVIVAVSLLRSGADSPGASDIDTPIGAVNVSISNGILRPQRGTPIVLSSPSCGGLLAKVDAIDCIEAFPNSTRHAMAFVNDGANISVSVFRIEVSGSGIVAEQIMNGDIGPSAQLGTGFSVHAYNLGLVTGDAFALLVEKATEADVRSTLEFIGTGNEGQVTTLGVYRGSGVDLAVDIDRVFVAMKRESNSGQDSLLLSTIYPAKAGWAAVDEVVTQVQLSAVFSEREVVLFRSSTAGLRPIPTTTTTSTTTTTTTIPPTTTTIPTSGLIPGYLLSCDGSWIAIVSSQTFERTESVLNKFPGAYAVRNEDACLSLNPTFSRGSDAGKPIYVVFFGPFYDRYSAQQQCLSLGRTTFSQCYVAPLTNNVSDRSIRFGPTD